MKLNRKWILLVALVLSVAMATTGTLAYLTDEDKDVNTMTLGKVEIVQNEQERREGGILDEFTPNKPAYPAVGEIAWDETGVNLNGVEYKVFDDGLKNVIDKFVTVTNTGKSDAYVRTIVAIEAPEYDPNNLIHVNVNVTGVTNTPWAPVDIDGVNYVYSVFTYEKALAPDETSAPSLMQLFLDKETTNEDVAKFGEEWDVLVLSQAVQVMGFEEMGAAAALDEAFDPVTAENLEKWLGETEVGSPGDKHDTNNPPMPFAKVTILDEDDVLPEDGTEPIILNTGRTINTNGSWGGLHVGQIPLDVAYQFEPTMSLEEGLESKYRYWHADFVVSVNKDVPAYGIGLAGYYALFGPYNDYCWVMMAHDDVITAGTEIRLVEALGNGGIFVNYEELCRNGNDGVGFLCGAVALDGKTIEGQSTPISAQLESGTTLTVELRLYETKDPADTDSNTTNEETGKYITAGVYTYTFE